MSENDEQEFAALFAASTQAKRIQNGQRLEGTIVAIGPDVAFVDVGGKGEATIELAELRDEDGALEVAVGDRIEATVVSTHGGVTLSRRLQRGAATARQLEDAFRAGLPVEGKVEGPVKGGYQVSVARQRAFCPISQMDTARDTDPASHVGRVYTFRDHRIRQRRAEVRRLAARAARGGAAGARGRGAARPGGRRRGDRPRRVRS